MSEIANFRQENPFELHGKCTVSLQKTLRLKTESENSGKGALMSVQVAVEMVQYWTSEKTEPDAN